MNNNTYSSTSTDSAKKDAAKFGGEIEKTAEKAWDKATTALKERTGISNVDEAIDALSSAGQKVVEFVKKRPVVAFGAVAIVGLIAAQLIRSRMSADDAEEKTTMTGKKKAA